MSELIRSYGLILVGKAKGSRHWRAVLTSGAVDRMSDRIFAPGLDVSGFRKNPVALASHDSRSFPVGR